jgi:hypothetical protein
MLGEDRQELTRMFGRGLDMLSEMCHCLPLEVTINK